MIRARAQQEIRRRSRRSGSARLPYVVCYGTPLHKPEGGPARGITYEGFPMTVSLPLEHVWVEPENGGESPPLLVLLHGRGSHENDLLPLAQQLPDELAILSLRAPTQLGPGYTWYELDLSGGGLHASQPDDEDLDRSLELVDASLKEAQAKYDVDPERIGLLGFSQGAILSLGALAERPDEYAWVVGLHGYLPARYDTTALQRAAGTPVFLGAGTRDQVIPVTRAEDASERLTAAGIDVTFRTYPIGHGTAPQEVEDVGEWVDSRL